MTIWRMNGRERGLCERGKNGREGEGREKERVRERERERKRE